MVDLIGCENYKSRNLKSKSLHCETIDNAIIELTNDKYYHTIIMKNKKYKLYLDIDNLEDDIIEFINKIKEFINDTYSISLQLEDFSYSQNDIKNNKYHIIIPKFNATYESMKILRNNFINKYPIYTKSYDISVYQNNKLFRLPNQSKGVQDGTNQGIHRIKQGILNDFIIDFIDESNNIDDILIKDIKKLDKKPDKKPTKKKIINDEIDELEEINIEELVKLLDKFPYDKFYESRDSWIMFLTLIRNAGGSWELAHKYSLNFPNHDPCACEKTFNSIKLKINNPLQQLKIICDKFYIPIVRKKQYFFDSKDEYDIYDFQKEILNTNFTRKTYLLDDIYPKLSKVCATINKLDAFIIKNGKDIEIKKTLRNILPTIIIEGEDNKKFKWDAFVNGIIELRYNKMDYILNDEQNEKIFNKWNGYDANIIENPNQEVIDAVNDLILKVFADNNYELYDYIISWFANIFQSSDKNSVALTLISEQGTGKTSMMELMNLMMGERNCDIGINGISAITQKHNTCVEGKRLLVINEMSSSRDDFRPNFDKIKSNITDSTIKVEPKGFPSYNCKNIGNYVFISNHEDSIIVEESDRRYQICKCSNAYQNNKTYWEKWRNLVLTENGRDSYYTYLMNYKVCNLHKIINIALRQEMINRSLPSSIKYLNYLIEINKRGNEKASMLFSNFKSWCDINNEKMVTNTKFGTDIKNKIKRIRKKDGLYYVLDSLYPDYQEQDEDQLEPPPEPKKDNYLDLME